MSALMEKIDTALRFCAVYAVIIVLFILNTTNLSLPISGSVEVPMMMMVIYYWSIYRPTLLPPWVVFLMGIVFDALSGLTLGLNAFVFLGLRWLVVDQRLFLMGQSFMMVWFVFGVVSVFTSGLQWMLYGLLQLHWTPLEPVGVMILSGIILFPVVSMVLNFSHRVLPSLSQNFGTVIK